MNPDPEFMRNYRPGVFHYEREADMAERAVEAYRGHLWAQVHALGVARPADMSYNRAITDVLDLIGPE